jgi:hypothetical protein
MPDVATAVFDRFGKPEEWDEIISGIPVLTPFLRFWKYDGDKPVRNADGDPTAKTVQYGKEMPNIEDPTFKIKNGLDQGTWKLVQNVTPLDLKETADNMQRLQAARKLVPTLSVGHTIDGAAQDKQPRNIGFGPNSQFNEGWGPEQIPALTVDFHIEKGHKPKEADKWQLPYRSAEYQPNRRKLAQISLLHQQPALEMGMVPLSGHDDTIFLQLGGQDSVIRFNFPPEPSGGAPAPASPAPASPPPPPNPNAGNATAPPNAMDPDPEFTQKFAACASKMYPHLKAMHDEHVQKMSAMATPAAPPAQPQPALHPPGPQSAGQPAPMPSPPASTKMSAIEETLKLQYESRIKALEDERVAEKKAAAEQLEATRKNNRVREFNGLTKLGLFNKHSAEQLVKLRGWYESKNDDDAAMFRDTLEMSGEKLVQGKPGLLRLHEGKLESIDPDTDDYRDANGLTRQQAEEVIEKLQDDEFVEKCAADKKDIHTAAVEAVKAKKSA